MPDATKLRAPGLGSGFDVGVVVETEGSGLRRGEQIPGLSGVLFGHEYLDGSQAIHRETVRVAQRLTAFENRDARGFEKRSNLLRVRFTACDKHALHLYHHNRPCCGNDQATVSLQFRSTARTFAPSARPARPTKSV